MHAPKPARPDRIFPPNTPEMSSRSASIAVSSAHQAPRIVARPVGRTQGSPPAAATIAASMGPFELRIWPDRALNRPAQTRRPSSEWPRGAGEKPPRPITASRRQERSAQTHSAPAGSNSSPLLSLRALGHNVFARRHRALGSSRTPIRTAGRLDVLEHDHGIGAAGTAAPVMISQAAPSGSGPAGASGLLALSHAIKAEDGRIASVGTAGIAVARRAGKGRLIPIGNQWLSKNPPRRLAQPDASARAADASTGSRTNATSAAASS